MPMNARILLVISGACLYTGSRVNERSSGRSVARDRAARVSMMRLSQSSCTGAIGSLLFSDASEPIIVSNTPAALIASWYCKNFLMLSLTERPHLIAVTTVAKLSSMSTMSDAPFAISVPVFIAKPTSASLSAGASLVPSPVTPTTSPCSSWSRPTRTNLSVGDDRASTRSRGSRSISSSLLVRYISRKSGPVIARCPASSS
mmetsp:Transcript_33981/g.104896  ORF Transcript_33981/g.104896 Transcript_33981/m.104896 type:complete len:202 (-) Transcript_33981:2131-2736(-)